MTTYDDDLHDTDVPVQAVRALKAAHLQAVGSGRPVVFVQHGKLVRSVNGVVTVLKAVPTRRKVAVLTKTIKT